jgi:NADH dehydrogenase FAD-containing subunit
MSKIAIVGATGPTGIHLVAELGKTAAAVAPGTATSLRSYFPRRQLRSGLL